MYKDLEIKVSRMWEVRTKIVPAVTGALGTINLLKPTGYVTYFYQHF